MVLGIYAQDGPPAETTYRKLHSSRIGAVCLIHADGTAQGASRLARGFDGARFNGEALIAVEIATPSSAELAARILREGGSSSVFLLGDQEPKPAPTIFPKSERQFLARLRESELALENARAQLTAAAKLERSVTPSAEWLLDNVHLTRTHIIEIRLHLPRQTSRFSSGRGWGGTAGGGYEHLYELAKETLRQSDNVLRASTIEAALQESQKTTPLSIGELWTFPLLLRMALIEALAELASLVSQGHQVREAALFWSNRLAAASKKDPETLDRAVAVMEGLPLAARPYFLTGVAEQLQDEEIALARLQKWLEQTSRLPLEDLVRLEHNREAAECVCIANAFGSLRTLSRIDFTEIFEATSLVEAELRQDPQGVYPRSDFATRDQCRKAVESVARYSGVAEIEVARRAVHLAGASASSSSAHVAYYLIDDGLAELERETGARLPWRTQATRTLLRHPTFAYLSGITILTAWFLAVVLGSAWDLGVRPVGMLIALGALAIFPISELVVHIANALIISLLPPGRLPKMNFKAGIPAEHATLVVVPTMLTSHEALERELERLEIRFLGNQERNLYYGLFEDFTDAPDATAPGDGKLLQAAREGIEQLNLRYPGDRFVLFHRPRVWSETEQKWIGRERKRGKIEDLNSFLCREGSAGILAAGKLDAPISFVITLDADTQLPPSTARRMIEAIAHPLNRVQLDPVTRVRTHGYTIIQPRVSIALPGANVTRFTSIFADATGTDPYCQTVSDAQQDLFREATYHGKAIYDVRAFYDSLAARFPTETLLSHDLIEGAHVGVGLATDIEIFEHMPLDYAGFSRRLHRWIRGDWQIAPWILGRVPGASGELVSNPLSVISRWRIFDNLRRSLVPVASLLLLLFGWLISSVPGLWTIMLGLAIAIPALAPLLERLARLVQRSVHGWRGAADELVRASVMLAFLPHQAWVSMDAIVRVTYRRWFSGRNLLEWQTAEGADHEARAHMSHAMRQLLVVSGLSLLLALVLQAMGAFAPTSAFALLWIVSPGLMRWLAHAPRPPSEVQLDHQDRLYLRRLARQTWRYFDDLVGPGSNWLPPDNSQLALHIEVAPRTSPTNIGLWLTSLLSARDFGYVSADEISLRCSKTLETLHRMEQYEGHLLNWYDTRSLEPLSPRYVSTVDSGNLLASLWTLQQGVDEILRAAIVGPSCLRGLADTLSILQGLCGQDPSAAVPLHALRRTLRGKVEGHRLIGRLRLASEPARQLRDRPWERVPGDERSYWASRLASELESWTQSVDRYLGWIEILAHPPDSFLASLGGNVVKARRRALHTAPSLKALADGASGPVDAILSLRGNPDLRPELAAWLDQLAASYEQSRANAVAAVRDWAEINESASRLADGINMRFLYDDRRHLFGVGYAVGGPAEFSSHYDLLASECRLASLVAIAKGDVPLDHWFSLGRPRVAHGSAQTLLSWSGTMFEYLMPLLFTRSFANSQLDYCCRDALSRQIEFGAEHKVPWGVSECAYSALDAGQTYQYRAFGVPTLALKRDLEDAVVVAPYATMLALPLDPETAIENLKRLEDLGLSGPMGLYEAIDFTRMAKRGGEPGVIVYAYMAHHQGMSLAALDNVMHHGAMQRRFHKHLRIRSVESLLFERIPLTKPPIEGSQNVAASVHVEATGETSERRWDEETAVPRVQLHGNGSYALMITNSGTGYSRWNGFDVTRWQSDRTLDPCGTFLYIRDLRTDVVWSAAPRPLGGDLGTSTVRFSADRAEFQRRVVGIDTLLDITVASEDDAEIRRLTITNRSLRTRNLEFTSYAELALTTHAAQRAHPVFAQMFIETECPDDGVLVAHRRKRSPEDPPIWAAHVLVGATRGLQYETSRAEFLGRCNSTAMPDALRRELSGSTGAVLDPVFSLRCRTTLEPRDRVELCFITIAAESRERLEALIAKYRRPESITRAFEMAWTRTQLEFRHLGIGPAGAHRFQELASHLVYPNPSLRAAEDRLQRNRFGQSDLWATGISGDLPMITVTVADLRGLGLVRELLVAHSYWRMRGFQADLIILNQESPSYDRPFRELLLRQVEAHSGQTGVDRPGGVFLRDWHSMPEEQRTLILAVSSVVLSGNRGPLQQQLSKSVVSPKMPLLRTIGVHPEVPSRPLPFLELPYFNGIGGFTRDAREYAVYLKPGDCTPAPWANVIANSNFGCVVSESGLGFTWCNNSQSQRLTPWHNDPLGDAQSEAIYIRDEESGAFWTPTALPIRELDAYRARHGQGYSVFEHNSHAIGQELTVFVPIREDGSGDPVKICRLRLRNDSRQSRRLTATYFAELVLGSHREDQQLHIRTWLDPESGALLARQTWTDGDGVAFMAAVPKPVSHTGDRAQFYGRGGSRATPSALSQIRLNNTTGASLEPAAALQVALTIEPGGQADAVFLLGQAASVEEVRRIIARYQNAEQVQAALDAVTAWWDRTLGSIQVRTPLLSVDFLMNRWLLYQSLSCRFWARSSLYQSGGAIGFRDQLQDSLAFVYAAPQLTRAHILASAARQFLEGDVQHWWHPENGRGVRTHCSDDLLWLPFAVARYVEITGDSGILDEQIPFLEGTPLALGDQDVLSIPTVSAQVAPLWEHCRRALDKAWRLGSHNLPLIGTGDWNDGMNRVGVEGRGESCWLAWFMSVVLEGFATLLEHRAAEFALTAEWRERAAVLSHAMEVHGWDGEWYLRGFFDNGSSLGSRTSEEARIDSLPQSWAVISGAADPERARRAMESAEHHLVDQPSGVVKLFAPPFDHSDPHPGYIMGYPPGLRENGGQYTHGSLWLAMARARMGQGHSAVRLLELMNPIEHNRNAADLRRYRGEPYVVAADVYAAAGMTGRAGWTWYTGSSAWMYRIWLEEVLGFRLRGNLLTLAPVIPPAWPGFEISYRYRSSTYQIKIEQASALDDLTIEVDGMKTGNVIALLDDGRTHQVHASIPRAQETEDVLTQVDSVA